MTMGVYALSCRTSGKIYIGSSVNVEKRWRQHREILGEMRHHSPKLQRAWNRFGEEDFAFSVIEVIQDRGLLRRLEGELIRKYNSVEEGFNCTYKTSCLMDKEWRKRERQGKPPISQPRAERVLQFSKCGVLQKQGLTVAERRKLRKVGQVAFLEFFLQKGYVMDKETVGTQRIYKRQEHIVFR